MSMASMVLEMLMKVAAEAPELVSEGEALFNDLAHGEDGVSRLAHAAATFAALAGHAANAVHVAVASDVKTPAPQPQPLAPSLAPSGALPPAPGVVTQPPGGDGPPLDAEGKPILNAADQAAAQSVQPR